MPVRPSGTPEEEDSRSWVWLLGDDTRHARYRLGTEPVGRESLRFVVSYTLREPQKRELRLWEPAEQERQLQSPSEPGSHLCDEEDMEEDTVGLRGEDTDSETSMVPRPLQSSSMFREGAVFRGTQRVSRASARNSSEDWGVVVTIHEIDLMKGRCSGDMMAENVPLATSPVVTHWEGEIVDCLNYSFVTCKWGATYGIDLAHWRKFAAFAPLNRKVAHAFGRCARLHESPFIFMRWKESFFVNARDEGCSLTIAGFYYVCLSRETGSIEGFYYDPNSMPYQKLELEIESEIPSFSSYEYA